MFAIGVGCRVGCEAAVTGSLLALGMLLPYSTTPPDGAAHMVAVDGRTADGLSSAGDELGTRQVFGHLSLVQALSGLSYAYQPAWTSTTHTIRGTLPVLPVFGCMCASTGNSLLSKNT